MARDGPPSRAFSVPARFCKPRHPQWTRIKAMNRMEIRLELRLQAALRTTIDVRLTD